MNSLANFLVKNILNEDVNPTTALFGGGFKPPTAGHLEVVKKAINNNPEVDKVIIYVGGKVRDGITQAQSIEIWDKFYKSQINKPVEILPSVAPVKDIYRYAKNNPEETVYWVIGAREGREDDLKDIASRSISIDKYPNLQLKTTSTPDGGMSGTNARKAIINNNFEEFERYLPKDVNKNAIWNILTKQELNESHVTIDMGKVNKALRKGIGHEKETDENIIAILDAHPNGSVPHPVFLDHYAKFDKYFGEEDDDRILDETGLEYLLVNILKLPSEDIIVVMNDYQKGNKDLEDVKWFEKYDKLHQDDEEWNPVGGRKFDDSKDNLKSVNKYLTKNKKLHEADPKTGTGKKPKGSGRRLYTDEDPSDTVKVKFSSRQDIIDTLNKSSFKSKSHARQSQVINLIHQRVRSAYNRAKDPDVKRRLKTALDYAEKRKEASKKKTQRLKKENIDPKAQAKHKGKSTPFGSAYEKVDETGLKVAKKNMDDYKRSNNPSGKKPKDPFGLNQFARELMQEEENFDTFDYPKHLKLYTKYMLDQGMDIRPLPKVKFVNDDVENSKEFLGKTAYYDPNRSQIVLYTLNRHPKDVMRSFSHEMIHHLQNIQDRLGDVSTTNTNQDDHINDLEKEANLLGTMTFRNWTDTLTEGILKEGRYDKISNEISSNIFNYWKKDFEAGKKASRYFENEENDDLEIDIDANITFLPNSEQLTIDGGAEESHSEDDSAYLKVRFEVDPKMLPEFWEEISMNLKDVVRHEIEHMTQAGTFSAGGYKKVYKKVDGKWEETDEYEWQGKDFKDDQIFRKMIDMELLPKAEYFKLAKEVDANLQGMYFRAKKEKRPFGDIINNYLDAQDITAKEKEEVLDLWRSRNKALNLPQF